MQFTGVGGDFGGGGYGNAIDNRIANEIQRFGNIRFSNFLLTISTNVRPQTTEDMDEGEEEAALTHWLRDNLNELFGSFENLNGNVLKPAGSDNSARVEFPANNRIGTVKSRIGIERGAAQRGQVHAHVLMEVMHRYDTPTDENGPQDYGMDKDYLGVHVNVTALREWLNQRIDSMRIPVYRRPLKIYVNSRLLTKNNDNTNKWLTLAYINKDSAKDDNEGNMRDLVADRQRADLELQQARDTVNRHEKGRHLVTGGEVRAPPMARTTAAPVPPQMVRTTAAPVPPQIVYQRPNLPLPRNFL